jgi:hypothetical protein
MGYFAICHDTENNSFGIWESNENAKWLIRTQLKKEPWNNNFNTNFE